MSDVVLELVLDPLVTWPQQWLDTRMRGELPKHRIAVLDEPLAERANAVLASARDSNPAGQRAAVYASVMWANMVGMGDGNIAVPRLYPDPGVGAQEFAVMLREAAENGELTRVAEHAWPVSVAVRLAAYARHPHPAFEALGLTADLMATAGQTVPEISGISLRYIAHQRVWECEPSESRWSVPVPWLLRHLPKATAVAWVSVLAQEASREAPEEVGM